MNPVCYADPPVNYVWWNKHCLFWRNEIYNCILRAKWWDEACKLTIRTSLYTVTGAVWRDTT